MTKCGMWHRMIGDGYMAVKGEHGRAPHLFQESVLTIVAAQALAWR